MTATREPGVITIPVTGMKCAGCVGRVERALEKAPGVLDASANLASGRAAVSFLSGEVEMGELARAVEAAGYGVIREETGASAEDEHKRDYRRLRRDFFVAAALTALILVGSLPMMLGLMPPIPVAWLNLVLLVLATPVRFWAGWRFYRGAWGALRHGRADMSTLVALGTPEKRTGEEETCGCRECSGCQCCCWRVPSKRS